MKKISIFALVLCAPIQFYAITANFAKRLTTATANLGKATISAGTQVGTAALKTAVSNNNDIQKDAKPHINNALDALAKSAKTLGEATVKHAETLANHQIDYDNGTTTKYEFEALVLEAEAALIAKAGETGGQVLADIGTHGAGIITSYTNQASKDKSESNKYAATAIAGAGEAAAAFAKTAASLGQSTVNIYSQVAEQEKLSQSDTKWDLSEGLITEEDLAKETTPEAVSSGLSLNF